ncbi:MAG TPA: hypothetical protein VGS27_29055 [Candidatus Sulfotelmatobacter sp.]|nr:hypothetical protein [Candidatus Sulfotelmatobacter sp.]
MNAKPEHIAAIQRFGYNETEATFLYLVATHSGYFTRSQFLRYSQQSKGCLVHRFTTKTLTQGHATAKEYGYQTLVFHLFSRQIYGAIDKDNLRNRRQLSKELIRTRLLILDFVLSDPDRQYLETEADKVRYFNRELGIPLTLIPCRTYKSQKSGSQTDRYFVDRFPVFLTSGPVPTPTFVYCDSDLPGSFGFLTHVRNYEQLLWRLHGFSLVYASPNSAKFHRAQRFFSRTFDSGTAVDSVQLSRYFHIRRLWESHDTESLTRADRDFLREGDKRFQGEFFESLYQKWSTGAVSPQDLKLQFSDSEASIKRGFSTHLLPNNYDIFRGVTCAPIRPAFETERSNSRSRSAPTSA